MNVTSGTTVDIAAQSQYANGSALASVINWTLWNGASVLGPSTTATFDAPFGGASQGLDLHLNVSWPSLGTGLTSYPLYSPSFLAVEAGGFVPRANALELSAQAGPGWGALPLSWSGTANVSGGESARRPGCSGTAPEAWGPKDATSTWSRDDSTRAFR